MTCPPLENGQCPYPNCRYGQRTIRTSGGLYFILESGNCKRNELWERIKTKAQGWLGYIMALKK